MTVRAIVLTDTLGSFPALDGEVAAAIFVATHSTSFALVFLFMKAPNHARAVVTESRFETGHLYESVNKTHLAVKQRVGFCEVVNHLLSTNSPILIFIQFIKLGKVWKVVPYNLKFLLRDVSISISVKVLEHRLHHLLYVFADNGRVCLWPHRGSPLFYHRWA